MNSDARLVSRMPTRWPWALADDVTDVDGVSVMKTVREAQDKFLLD